MRDFIIRGFGMAGAVAIVVAAVVGVAYRGVYLASIVLCLVAVVYLAGHSDVSVFAPGEGNAQTREAAANLIWLAFGAFLGALLYRTPSARR